jgi:hypothetical protein
MKNTEAVRVAWSSPAVNVVSESVQFKGLLFVSTFKMRV